MTVFITAQMLGSAEKHTQPAGTLRYSGDARVRVGPVEPFFSQPASLVLLIGHMGTVQPGLLSKSLIPNSSTPRQTDHARRVACILQSEL